MFSDSDTMPRRGVQSNRPSCATSQEELVDQSDISSAEDQSSMSSSVKKPTPTPTKKENVEVKMAKITITDEDVDDSGVSDIDNHSHEGKINSNNATTSQKKPVFKGTKPKTKPVTDICSDDAEDEGKSPKKVAATSKHKKPTTKKSATKKLATKVKEPETSDNESSSVLDTTNELPIKDAIPDKSNKKRASTSRDDEIVRKRAKFPANSYKPDSYDTLNKDDQLLFDLKTKHPDWQWKEIQVQFNLASQTSSETTTNKLKKNAGQELRLQGLKLSMVTGEMWEEIAESVAQNGGKKYEPTVLQDKHEVYQRLGRIDEKGDYLAWTEEDENQRKATEHSDDGEDTDDKENEVSDEDEEVIDMDNDEA
ncbi:hypothetical protein EYC80_001898 [Monilinia laxa]|uniref:Uncharacterized protein n=1 Tax=Monilinia laxa TaxID=61186 RepID=A0A5N6K6J7_MONLA|nr:hypothetical protein EYC80_001898 [Monilinia laxa]